MKITSKNHIRYQTSRLILLYIQMIGILLILSFAKSKVIARNSKLPEDLETLWLNSQVMIYHNSKPSQDFSIQEPDCFGNALTEHYVITAASCFIELNYKLQCHKRDCKSEQCNDRQNHQSKTKPNQINFQSIKKSIKIEKTLIAQVS
jgi:hypothetical protein